METTNRDSLREQTAGELRALLARRRVSASELARRLSWKQSYIARRIDGRVALDLDDLQAIASVLGVSVLDLLPTSVREVTSSTAAARDVAHNIRSVEKTRRPRDNRPSGHAVSGSTRTVSADRASSRRPQRVGSASRPTGVNRPPMSRRAA